MVCCQEDNCNGNSISYIRHSTSTPTPTTLSTTKMRAPTKIKGGRLRDISQLRTARVESATEKTTTQKTVAAKIETTTQGSSVAALQRLLLVLSLGASVLLLSVFS